MYKEYTARPWNAVFPCLTRNCQRPCRGCSRTSMYAPPPDKGVFALFIQISPFRTRVLSCVILRQMPCHDCSRTLGPPGENLWFSAGAKGVRYAPVDRASSLSDAKISPFRPGDKVAPIQRRGNIPYPHAYLFGAYLIKTLPFSKTEQYPYSPRTLIRGVFDFYLSLFKDGTTRRSAKRSQAAKPPLERRGASGVPIESIFGGVKPATSQARRKIKQTRARCASSRPPRPTSDVRCVLFAA